MCDFKSAYHTAEHSDTHYQLTKIKYSYFQLSIKYLYNDLFFHLSNKAFAVKCTDSS